MAASYVVHSLPGRVRIRHPFLATEEGMARACEVLAKVKGVQEVQPGYRSLLLFFAPELALENLCTQLESAIPEFAETGADSQAREKEKNTPTILGVSPRRAESRTLLACMGVSIALGFVGSGGAHVLASSLFGLMTLRHVWMRRKAL